jgi:hypothetical protein
MSRLSAIRRLIPAEIIEPDEAPRSIDEVRQRYDYQAAIERHARILIFMQLAERIPEGYRFTGYTHVDAWCKVQMAEFGQMDVAALGPIVLERLRLVANEIAEALDCAGYFHTAEPVDHRTYLLEKAHAAWQAYRRERSA